MTTTAMEKEVKESGTTKVNVVTTTIATSTTVKNNEDTATSSPPVAPAGSDTEAGRNEIPTIDDDDMTVTGNNMTKDENAVAAGNTPPTPTASTDVYVLPATTTQPSPSSPLSSDHSSRFPLWYALLVFSAVTLISLLTDHKHTPSTLNTSIASATTKFVWFAEEKWILSVTVMSLLLSCMACVAQFTMRQNFVGMPLEGLVVG